MNLRAELTTEQQFRLRRFEMELAETQVSLPRLKALLLESVRQNLLYQGLLRQALTAELRGDVAAALGKDVMIAPVNEGGENDDDG